MHFEEPAVEILLCEFLLFKDSGVGISIMKVEV
jgi:hypothetical protein